MKCGLVSEMFAVWTTDGHMDDGRMTEPTCSLKLGIHIHRIRTHIFRIRTRIRIRAYGFLA